MSMNPTPLISSQVHVAGAGFVSLEQALRDASHYSVQIPPEAIVDEFDRFKIWAGNIAAHRKGRRSLEFRLRDAAHLKDETHNLLVALHEAVQRALAIVVGLRRPWDELSDSDSDSGSDSGGSRDDTQQDSTELRQLLASIKSTITCLFRLSMAVREPAPESQHRSMITVDKSYFEEHDIMHVKEKFPGCANDLAERLGRAISGRRQYLSYREEHHQKLAKNIDSIGFEEPKTEHTSNSTEATPLPARTNSFDVLDGDDALSQTSYASSANSNTTIRVPPLPNEAHEQEHFECPLCFMIVSIHTNLGWKQHVYKDLHPYSCTFDSCTTAERLYDSRRDWFTHELEAHRASWQCIEGCDKTFSTRHDFEAHISTLHADLASPNMLSALRVTSRKPADLTMRVKCPLCDLSLSLRAFQRHVGRHQEQLALFALPPNLEETEDGVQNSDSDSDSASLSGSHAAVDAAIEEEDEDEEEESYLIKCICGISDDDGNTVLCEKCNTWQHIVCFYDSVGHVPDVHECTDCLPRFVDVKRAVEKQRRAAAIQTSRAKLEAISSKFHTKFVPLCLSFIANLSQEKAERDFEYNKLTDTVMTQILWKLDAVETEGDPYTRTRRREVVKEVQVMLNKVDESIAQPVVFQDPASVTGSISTPEQIDIGKGKAPAGSPIEGGTSLGSKGTDEEPALKVSPTLHSDVPENNPAGFLVPQESDGAPTASTLEHSTSDPRLLAQQPTYIKVSKKHLDVDTLHYYNLPYEVDKTDPDFFIILRELDARETEVLFEHTRRLHAQGTSHPLLEERCDPDNSHYTQPHEVVIDTAHANSTGADGMPIMTKSTDHATIQPPAMNNDRNFDTMAAVQQNIDDQWIRIREPRRRISRTPLSETAASLVPDHDPSAEPASSDSHDPVHQIQHITVDYQNNTWPLVRDFMEITRKEREQQRVLVSMLDSTLRELNLVNSYGSVRADRLRSGLSQEILAALHDLRSLNLDDRNFLPAPTDEPDGRGDDGEEDQPHPVNINVLGNASEIPNTTKPVDPELVAQVTAQTRKSVPKLQASWTQMSGITQTMTVGSPTWSEAESDLERHLASFDNEIDPFRWDDVMIRQEPPLTPKGAATNTTRPAAPRNLSLQTEAPEEYKEPEYPLDARWTKIDRKMVNPEALEEAGERFEERQDCIIVLRVLTKMEVQMLADRTQEIRDARKTSEYDLGASSHETTREGNPSPDAEASTPVSYAALQRNSDEAGDIMHACEICKEEFKHPDDLAEHGKIHTRP